MGNNGRNVGIGAVLGGLHWYQCDSDDLCVIDAIVAKYRQGNNRATYAT